MILNNIENPILKDILYWADNYPNKIAIYYGKETITYKELIEIAKNFCVKMKESKMGPTAFYGDRDPDMIATYLASWMLGRPFIALDIQYPFERNKLILQESFTTHIVSNEDISEKISFSKSLYREDLEFSCLYKNKESKIAYLSYSLNSISNSKIHTNSIDGLYELIKWARKNYSDAELDCVLASTTVNSDLSMFEIFVPLSSGKSIFLIHSIFNLIDYNFDFSKISLINTCPSYIEKLLEEYAMPENVMTVNVAGGNLTEEVVEDIYDSSSSIKKVYNIWGYENKNFSTRYLCPIEEEYPFEYSELIPLGKGIEKTKIYILDENNNKLSNNKEGEICVYDPNINNDLSDLSSFIEKTIEIDNEKIYKTGNIGSIDNNGNLHFKNRLDSKIKIKGYLIDTEEIEAQILRLDNVIEAIVIKIEIEGITKLAACINIFRIKKSKKRILKESLKKNTSADYNADSKIKKLVRIFKDKLSKILPHYMLPEIWHISEIKLARNTNNEICKETLEKEVLLQIQQNEEKLLEEFFEKFEEVFLQN